MKDVDLFVEKAKAIAADLTPHRVYEISHREMSVRFDHRYDAVCLYEAPEIYFSSRLRDRPDEMVYTLLHEIGHGIDFSRSPGLMQKRIALTGFEIDKIPLEERKFLYQDEVNACNLADQLLPEFRDDVDFGKAFAKRDHMLGLYRRYYLLEPR